MANEKERKILFELVDSLPEMEKKVIRLRYGLDDNKTKTLLEVGNELGITREKVRQLEEKAIKRLREANKKD